ncbi:acyl-CoA thioesterase [Halovulum dunhuangense]|uniref:Acyl-CoA thioesterase n=1 Tax=Halovulum dunhuangense TaxID=1505036 RepID=A0A849L429_9RHOB|nr:thioesterase family protein [Halovulum dunhuangense]NNU81168.1 acyl-CoA thioesterase [Halovulum dunhuangense]
MTETEVYRAIVTTADIDHLGHMNVGRYMGICGDGVFAFQALLGLDHADIRDGRQISFAAVHAECDFRSEVRVGETLALFMSVLEIGNRSVLFRHRMTAGLDARPVFDARLRSALMDLRTRRAVPIPDDIRARLEPHLAGPAA